jgi:hypothetical protein
MILMACRHGALAICERLIGFLGAGDLVPDARRLAVAGVQRQPVVAQRARAWRQGEGRLVEQLGERDDLAAGQRVGLAALIAPFFRACEPAARNTRLAD